MKKSYYLFLLLLVAATSFSVHAQTGQKFPDFKLGVSSKLQTNGMQKVNPNEEKEKGILMYATTLDDYYNQERGWYKFWSKEPQNAIKLKTWNPGSQSFVDGLRCGCWGGDAYYAFYIFQYSLGYDYPYAFVKVEPETGELDIVKNFEQGDDFYDNWHSYTLYCMTYNPVKDEVYALGQTTKENQAQVSTLYKIDRATGTPTKLHDFDFISFAMSVDMEGTLWVQNSIYEGESNVGAKLIAYDTDNFDVKKEVKLSYNGSSFVTAYYGTMSFDYTTGDLYWIALRADDNKQQLYTVNLETGNMEALGAFWGDFVGLYIPYTLPENENAPAKVQDLKATPDMTGSMKSTLTWTNPSLQWNKKELTDLKEVQIYKDGSETPAATLPAEGKEGQEMSWTDETPNAGINTYYVVPCNEFGKGIKDSISVFVGEDVPGAVGNIVVKNNGESVTVTWDAPEYGMNGGYVNPDGLKYTIIRYPDEIEIAKDQTETTFTDTNLGNQQCYYYTIQTSNVTGVGETTETEKFIAGAAYTTPVKFNFTDQILSEAWTNLGDWEWSGGSMAGDEGMVTTTHQRENCWLISPDVKLEAGKTYKITTKIKTYYGPNGCKEDFRIAIGQGKTAGDMTNVLREEKDYSADEYYYVKTFEDIVEIKETGVYNYGIDVSLVTGDDIFSLQEVTIEEIHPVDMSAVSLDGIIDAVCNGNNTCKVKLYNNSYKTADKYEVKIARVDNGNYVVLGSTTDVPAVEMFKTAEVTVTYVPDVEDQVELVGLVEIEGDGDESNNVTEPYTVNVLPEGMPPYNVLVTDENTIGDDTRIPMSFIVGESMTQTLYFADEINVETDGSISRIAYEYTGNEITSVLGPVDVKIYMCNTDKTIFKTESEAIPLEDMTQVYEGSVTINPGTNFMSFILSEEFEYKKDKNLCIAVVKNGLVGNDYPALFKMFNNDDFENTRSILSDGSPMAYWKVPVIHMAVRGIAGNIENVNIGANSVWYDSKTSTLNFNENNLKKVYVYDISGKMIKMFNLNGSQNSLAVNLPVGLYIIHTVAADGSMNNVKVNVCR